MSDKLIERAADWRLRRKYRNSMAVPEADKLIQEFLSENETLKNQLRVVSTALLEAHSMHCTFPLQYHGKACECIVEDKIAPCTVHRGENFHKCEYFKPCECAGCKIAGEAAA